MYKGQKPYAHGLVQSRSEAFAISQSVFECQDVVYSLGERSTVTYEGKKVMEVAVRLHEQDLVPRCQYSCTSSLSDRRK